MIETLGFQIVLSKSVGQITELKIQKIVDLGYDVENHVPGVFAQFNKKGANEPLVTVAQNQISLAIPRVMAVEDFLSNEQKILEVFEPLLETLLLEWDCVLGIQLERSYPSSKNTFEVSTNKIINPGELLVQGALSVGFRIPFKQERISGEIKLEPLFSNPSRYFMSATIQSEIKNKEQAGEVIVRIRNLMFDELQPKARLLFG